MPSAPVPLRQVVAGPPRVARAPRTRPTWRARSRKERLAVGTAVGVVAMLVAAGAIYTLMGLSPSSPARIAPAADRFSQTRAARIVVPADDGLCREYTFNNENGAFGEYRLVPCADNSAPSVGAPNEAGFEAFKQAFGKR